MSTIDATATPAALQAALQYTSEGFRVFPTLPDKKRPLHELEGGHWLELATTDPVLVIEWWTEWPAANILVVCGEQMVVLDFDTKKGKPGEQSALEVLGEGWKQRYRYTTTPSGGYHVWFVLDERTRAWGNRNLGRLGLDIQGAGAYVVVPPSRTGDYPDENTVAGPYLEVNPHLPRLAVADDGVVARVGAMLEREGGRSSARVEAGATPDWRALLAVGVELDRAKLPAWFSPAWDDGDWSRWGDDRTAGLRALHGVLYRQMSREQVLAAEMGNEHVVAVASTGNRSGRTTPEAQAAWLWADICRCCVSPFEAVPPGPGVVGEPHAAPGAGERVAAPGGGGAGGTLARVLAAVYALDPGGWHAGLARALFVACDESLGELELEQVWEAVQGLGLGVTRGVWSRALADARRQVKEERLAAVRAKQLEQLKGYVHVVEAGSFFALDTWGWVKRQSVKDELALDDEGFRALLSAMPHVRRATYQPHNPWAPGYDREGAVWNRDRHSGRTELNMWAEPVFEPVLGASDEQVQPWLEMVRLMVGVPEDLLGHVLDWLAFTLQHPGEKINHMLLLGGAPGIGKDTMLAPVLECLGRKNVHEVNAAQVVGSEGFDSPKLGHSSLMVLQELATGGKGRMTAQHTYNALKVRLASPPLEIELNVKYLAQFSVPNLINVLAFTNHRDALHIEPGDRRICQVWCTGKRRQHDPRVADYWAAMHRWLAEGGGNELVAGWLLGRDVTGFNPGAEPPESEWRLESKLASLDSLEALLTEAIEDRLGLCAWDLVEATKLTDWVHAQLLGQVQRKELPTESAVSKAMHAIGVSSERYYLHSRTKRERVFFLREGEIHQGASNREIRERLVVQEIVG